MLGKYFIKLLNLKGLFVVIKKYLKERLISARVLLVAAKKAPSLNAGLECKININFRKRKHFDFFFFIQTN